MREFYSGRVLPPHLSINLVEILGKPVRRIVGVLPMPYPARVRRAWIAARGMGLDRTCHRSGVYRKTVNLLLDRRIAVDERHAGELLLEGEALYG